jgi:hypothetical protein
MKKLIAILLLTLTAGSAMAQHHGHRSHGGYHGGHRGHGGNWIAPAIIGGVIGYGLSRPYYEPYYAPPPVYYTPPPVVYSPPQVVQPVNCIRYIYQDQYGNVTREETRCN